jgi:hypothetical protein
MIAPGAGANAAQHRAGEQTFRSGNEKPTVFMDEQAFLN